MSTHPISSPAPTKSLLERTRVFQRENKARSWFHVIETCTAFGVVQTITLMNLHWSLRLLASLVLAGVITRFFILYHDYLHGALLRDSKIVMPLMWLHGLYMLTPFRVWKQTHNYHHANTAKLIGSHIGSYLTVSTEMWRKMSPKDQQRYRLYRHPLVIVFAYFTVFFYGMAIASFKRSPKKNWDSLVAILAHLALSASLIFFAGFDGYFFGLFVPLFVAMMLGAYLFYAQHNFPDMTILPREDWDHERASLESSSYMSGGPIFHWFTGNIGYHHIHHLNSRIPFYRLPEAMAAIPELQVESQTSLSFGDIREALSYKLWDPKSQRMVGFPAASATEIETTLVDER